MKLQKIILAAALGLSSINAFANWQPYVGGALGINNGNFSTNIDNPALLSNLVNGGYTDSNKGPYSFNSPSTMISPQIQLGIANQYNKLYLGFEASLQYNNNKSTSNGISDTAVSGGTTAIFNSQITNTLQWNTSLTTQLGYFLTQNLMPYAKIGITAAEGDVNENFNITGGNVPLGSAGSTHASPWMLGPTASLGAQYTITKHLRGFAEANYTYLWGNASPTLNLDPTFYNTFGHFAAAPKQKYTYSSWTFKVGTNYYF